MDMKKFLCLISSICLINISFVFSQEVEYKEMISKLEREIDSVSGCFSFDIGAPTPVWDTSGKVIGFQQLLYFENDKIKKLLKEYSQHSNRILMQILKSENIGYSWAALVLLHYQNALDATSIVRYKNSNCDIWFNSERAEYILKWERKFSN
jgi:hypothetical protein